MITPETTEREFAGADFGDSRLGDRQVTIGQKMALNPAGAFPANFNAPKDLESTYAFFNNQMVTPQRLMEPHYQATTDRCIQHGAVLLVSDTSEYEFEGERTGLGPLSGKKHGLLGHVTIAVAEGPKHDVLGTVAAQIWARPAKPATKRKRSRKERYEQKDKESAKWTRGAALARAQLPRDVNTIEVEDRDGDDYKHMCELVDMHQKFAIRVKYDRRVKNGDDGDDDDEHDYEHLFEALCRVRAVVEREVWLSERKPGTRTPKALAEHPPRERRLAKLCIGATSVTIPKPQCSSKDLSEKLCINIVRVWEPDPPEGQEPVEWRIFTNLDVSTTQEIERVVDIYCSRWVVEEFFKATKSGCKVLERQFTDGHALMNVMAMAFILAYLLMSVRSAERTNTDQPASNVLTPRQLQILRIETADLSPLPDNPTAGQALLALAGLGGHQPRNGRPGLFVLQRGLVRLLLLDAYEEKRRRFHPDEPDS